jgi:hypothetical protein
MMLRRYYCLSCKASFEREIKERRLRMECPTCHDETYVRYATPKQAQGKMSIDTRLSVLRRHYTEAKVSIELQKFKLVYEHNLVAALKRHVKSKEEFHEALRLAKMQTRQQRAKSLEHLRKWGCVKHESDLGWEFLSPTRSKFDKLKSKKKNEQV